MINFHGYAGDVPQCTIKSGTKTALSGGTNFAFSGTTIREYGKSIMFEPIPLYMLHHNAEKPQVTVKVNGIEGVCPNFNCDYSYAVATSSVTA